MKITISIFPTLIPPEAPTKVGRVLHHLACGDTINRFQAERQLNDHVLNSTISELANRHMIDTHREWETVPGYDQSPTRCVRYSIDQQPENLTRCYWRLRSWGWRNQQFEMDFPPQPPEAA